MLVTYVCAHIAPIVYALLLLQNYVLSVIKLVIQRKSNGGNITNIKPKKLNCPKYRMSVYICMESFGDYVLYPSSVSWDWSPDCSSITAY